MSRPDIAAIKARADAATVAIARGDQSGMPLADRVRSMRYAFAPRDGRLDSVRKLGDLADLVELSSQDVPALCARVAALEAALRDIVPVLDRVVSAACAKVPPDYAETTDALDAVRAVLEGPP